MNINRKTQIGLILRHSEWIIIGIYNLIVLSISALFYFLIPVLMSYPPHFKKISEVVGFSYNLQFLIAISFSIMLSTCVFLVGFRDFRKRLQYKESDLEQKNNTIRRKCINLPYFIFIAQIALLLLPTIVMTMMIKDQLTVSSYIYIKLIFILFSILTLIASFSHAIIKPVFTKILSNTYIDQGLEGFRIGLRIKILIQIVPVFIVAIIIASLLGYNSLIVQKGNMIFDVCEKELIEALEDQDRYESLDGFMEEMDQFKIKDVDLRPFVLLPNGEIKTKDNEAFSRFFTYFIKHPLKDRVFGNTLEDQGVIKKLSIDGRIYTVGFKYQVYSQANMQFFMGSIFVLLLMSIFVLYVFSKSLTNDIKMVTTGLIKIASKEVNFNQKLAITSNDEFADLILAFNKIQTKVKMDIERTKKDQDIIIEQQRLVHLGQLAGGIAENFKLPLTVINEGLMGLRYLALAYKGSVEKDHLNKSDHEQLAEAMLEWLDKIKPYNNFMSDTMKTIKEQLIIPNSFGPKFFILAELSKRIDILMEHQLSAYPCTLIKKFNADLSRSIQGEVSYLIQIINNLLLNAIQAYDEQGGIIEFGIYQEKEDVILTIRDYGCGIPLGIKEKLFKNIMTTKGEEATGLSLYIAYSKIKAGFKGEIWLESEQGKGTTVYIKLPTINEFLI